MVVIKSASYKQYVIKHIDAKTETFRLSIIHITLTVKMIDY